VVGYVTVWYQSFWLKHRAWYGPGLLVRVSWLRSNYDLEVENLRRNGIAESTQKLERQRSFVRDRRIVTIPFEFRSDHHCGIKRDLDHWIGGQVNKGHPMKVKQRLSHNHQISLERNRRWGGIAGIGKKIKVSASCEPTITQDH
jgi:hypothetical protein